MADRPRSGRFSGRINRPPGNPDLSKGGAEADAVRGAAWPEDRISRPSLRGEGRPDGGEPVGEGDDGGFDGPPPFLDRDEGLAAPKPSGGERRGLTLAVALVALGGFAAIVGYAYQTGQSNRGESLIPVVEAEPGPVKQKPSDPGGLEVPHTDKGVLNDSQDGGAGQTAERLLPEPETPVAPPPSQDDDGEAGPSLDLTPEGPGVSVVTERELTEEELLRRVEDLTRRIQELQEAARQEPAAPAPAPVPVQAPAPAPVSGPADQPEAAPPPSPAQADPEPAVTSPPAAQPTGGYRIQLAALRSDDAARNEWQRLARRYPDIVGGLELVIVPVAIEGRGTFYRIQGGYFDEAGARAACQTLTSQGQACIVRR